MSKDFESRVMNFIEMLGAGVLVIALFSFLLLVVGFCVSLVLAMFGVRCA